MHLNFWRMAHIYHIPFPPPSPPAAKAAFKCSAQFFFGRILAKLHSSLGGCCWVFWLWVSVSCVEIVFLSHLLMNVVSLPFNSSSCIKPERLDTFSLNVSPHPGLVQIPHPLGMDNGQISVGWLGDVKASNWLAYKILRFRSWESRLVWPNARCKLKHNAELGCCAPILPIVISCT